MLTLLSTSDTDLLSAKAASEVENVEHQFANPNFLNEESLTALIETRSGPYDLIVVDPPSYQKGSFIATKDYARLMRRLPDLLVPGGQVLLCLNAPELGTDFLRGQMAEITPELEFVERLANPAVFADVDEERSLKVMVYRAPALTEAPQP